jgi:hypothetical protein
VRGTSNPKKELRNGEREARWSERAPEGEYAMLGGGSHEALAERLAGITLWFSN